MTQRLRSLLGSLLLLVFCSTSLYPQSLESMDYVQLIQELKTRYQQQSQLLQELTLKYLELRSLSSNLKKINENLMTQLDRLEIQLMNLNKLVEDLRRQIEFLETYSQDLEDKLQDLTIRYQKLETYSLELESQIQQLEKSLRDLRIEFQAELIKANRRTILIGAGSFAIGIIVGLLVRR